jgi:hypothetical protein
MERAQKGMRPNGDFSQALGSWVREVRYSTQRVVGSSFLMICDSISSQAIL